ncbi:hypothetical protein COLO4_16271 [Corchorus olitorius]|uniref:Uncharacterized protein n=1 Tax=Corchorus olitorius TaxID=93759 RepID=A0A1R3JID1_9ROSI|nr:hypothetical protein COLO4_16271 [Corchorus olitorius]
MGNHPRFQQQHYQPNLQQQQPQQFPPAQLYQACSPQVAYPYAPPPAQLYGYGYGAYPPQQPSPYQAYSPESPPLPPSQPVQFQPKSLRGMISRNKHQCINAIRSMRFEGVREKEADDKEDGVILRPQQVSKELVLIGSSGPTSSNYGLVENVPANAMLMLENSGEGTSHTKLK